MAVAFRRPGRLHERLVGVTPAPGLAGLQRTHDRVANGVGMCAGMTHGRGVTASDVAACQAETQVDPLRSDAQAVLASLKRVRLDGADRREMGAGDAHGHAIRPLTARFQRLVGLPGGAKGLPQGPDRTP